MTKRYEFFFDMTCDGCSNAAKRNLAKIGVEESNVEAIVADKKIFVTTDLSSDDVLTALKKTGRTAEFKGEV